MSVPLLIGLGLFGLWRYSKRNEPVWLPTARGLPPPPPPPPPPPSGGQRPAQPPAAAPQGTRSADGEAPPPSSSKAPSGEKPQIYKVRDMQRLDAGATLAQALVRELQQKGKGYSRELLKRFQLTAGITVDGIYGPQSAGALKWFTVTAAQKDGIEIAPHVGRGVQAYAPSF